MATKPIASFTWATDANYSSGPATGQPTKVAIPTPAQGLVPGDDLIPEYLNNLFNALSGWTDWLLDGSSAGALDAHIVETDSGGDTAVNNLDVNNITVADSARVLNEVQAQEIVTFGTASSFAESVELTQTQASGQGVDVATRGITVNGADGRNQAPAAGINNDGARIILAPGRPGTGLTTQDGGPGVVILDEQGLSVSGNSGQVIWCVFVIEQSGTTVQYQMPRAMREPSADHVGYIIAKALFTDRGSSATAFHSEANFVFPAAMGSAGAPEDNYVIDETGVAWAPNSPVLTWQKPSATELRLQIAEQSGGDVSGTVWVTYQRIDHP